MGALFQKAYDRLMAPLERGLFGRLRQDLLKDICGEVLEMGAGTGINFSLYPMAAHVTAIEPASIMRLQAQQRARQAKVPVTLVAATGEALPFAKDHFDAVVVTLVLCTVRDPVQVLAEIRRVLKPGGRLYLLEHVRAEQSLVGHIMDWMTPAWAHLCDGCHLNRRTLDAVQEAGFEVRRLQAHAFHLVLALQAVNRK